MSDTMIPTRVLGRQGLIVSAWVLGAWACYSPTGQQTNRSPSPQSIKLFMAASVYASVAHVAQDPGGFVSFVVNRVAPGTRTAEESPR